MSYTANIPSSQSQILTIDALGRITASCNSMFDLAALTEQQWHQLRPYLVKVVNYLNSPGNGVTPLFFPALEIQCGQFNKVCDVTFVKSSDLLGNTTFTCLIAEAGKKSGKVFGKSTGQNSNRQVA